MTKKYSVRVEKNNAGIYYKHTASKTKVAQIVSDLIGALSKGEGLTFQIITTDGA